MILLIGGLKFLLSLFVHLFDECLLVGDVVSEVIYGDVRDVFKGLVVLLLFVGQL